MGKKTKAAGWKPAAWDGVARSGQAASILPQSLAKRNPLADMLSLAWRRGDLEIFRELALLALRWQKGGRDG